MEAVGRWRCGSCGAWNGEESETTKVLANIRRRSAERVPGSKTDEADNQSSGGDGTDDGVMVGEGEEESDTGAEVKPELETTNAPGSEEIDPEPSRRTTRSRSKASKSKG